MSQIPDQFERRLACCAACTQLPDLEPTASALAMNSRNPLVNLSDGLHIWCGAAFSQHTRRCRGSSPPPHRFSSTEILPGSLVCLCATLERFVAVAQSKNTWLHYFCRHNLADSGYILSGSSESSNDSCAAANLHVLITSYSSKYVYKCAYSA